MGECITVIPGPVELFILGAISPMGIDPVHLNLRACAMDWRTQFAIFFFFFFFWGGGGVVVSWVTGRAHSCITSSSENIVQEPCESRGDRPGLSILTGLLAAVDVNIY